MVVEWLCADCLTHPIETLLESTIAWLTLAWHIHCNDLIVMIRLMYFTIRGRDQFCLTIPKIKHLFSNQNWSIFVNAPFRVLIEHSAMKVTKSLFSYTCLLHKSKLCGLSTGKVVEGVWLPKGEFMGCEGQSEQNAEGNPAMSPFFIITMSWKPQLNDFTINNNSITKKLKHLSNCGKLIAGLHGFVSVNSSLILKKKVAVGNTWHAHLAHQEELQVKPGCFVCPKCGCEMNEQLFLLLGPSYSLAVAENVFGLRNLDI